MILFCKIVFGVSEQSEYDCLNISATDYMIHGFQLFYENGHEWAWKYKPLQEKNLSAIQLPTSELKELEHKKLGWKVLNLKYDLGKSLGKEMWCKMADTKKKFDYIF